MRRLWLILSVVLLLAYGTSRFSGPVPVRASSHLHAVDLKKKCHYVTKQVHGKKKRVKVCKTVKPKPTPTATVSPDAFGFLGDITTDGQRNLYFTDWTKCRVEKLSPTGHLLLTFGSFTDCTNSDAPNGPYGIALDAQENIWVSDAGTAKVTEFSPTGQVLRAWGTPGIAITSIGVSPKGEIAVADVVNHAIQFFTLDGTHLRTVGRQGEGPGRFRNYLFTLVFDAQDNLYVADHSDGEIQKFSPDGTPLAQYGQGSLGSFVNGLALSTDGTMYVQAAEHGIDKVAPDGRVSNFTPNAAGQGIAIDPVGNIWAANEDDNSPNGQLDEFSPDGKLLQSLSQPAS